MLADGHHWPGEGEGHREAMAGSPGTGETYIANG